MRGREKEQEEREREEERKERETDRKITQDFILLPQVSKPQVLICAN